MKIEGKRAMEVLMLSEVSTPAAVAIALAGQLFSARVAEFKRDTQNAFSRTQLRRPDAVPSHCEANKNNAGDTRKYRAFTLLGKNLTANNRCAENP